MDAFGETTQRFEQRVQQTADLMAPADAAAFLQPVDTERDNRGGLVLTAAAALERFGDLTLEQVRSRARCDVCGHRGPRIILDCWVPTGKGWGGPPF